MSLKERRKSYETQDFFADISKYDSQIRSFVPSPSVHKSPEKAVSFRCSGNLLYSQKKYKDAVLIYNLAILNARFEGKQSSEAALALANRAMCYYHMGLVKEALRDIQSAELLGYPDGDKLSKRGRQYKDKLHQSACLPEREDRREPHNLPYTIFHTQNAGRGLKANRKINAGELIISDPAYASLLEFAHLDSFCYNCIQKIQHHQILPCTSCTQVRYCSIQCSLQNHKTHKYECKYIDLLKQNLAANAPAKLLSMKIILASDPEQVMTEDCQSDEAILLSSDYSNMLRLVDHESSACALNQGIVFLTSLIKSRHDRYSNLKPEDQLFLAHKLLVHARQIKWNAMSISHRSLVPSDFDSEVKVLREDLIGIGLFFRQLLINHSCDPNIQTCGFNGNRVFLQAIKNIEGGDEILNSYGMFSKWQSYEYRQLYLKENYNFICQCSACRRKQEPLIRAYKCPAVNCNGPVVEQACLLCQRCVTEDEILAIRKATVSANQAISAAIKYLNEYLYDEEEDANKFAVMQKMFLDSYYKLKKVLYRDHRDVIMTLDTICSFFLKTEPLPQKETAIRYAMQLLKDTRRVFDEEVHLLNTMVKVIHCLHAFRHEDNDDEQFTLAAITRDTYELLMKILPLNFDEISILVHDLETLTGVPFPDR